MEENSIKKLFKREDFKNSHEYQKYKKRLIRFHTKQKPEPKFDREHEACKRWAEINNES